MPLPPGLSYEDAAAGMGRLIGLPSLQGRNGMAPEEEAFIKAMEQEKRRYQVAKDYPDAEARIQAMAQPRPPSEPVPNTAFSQAPVWASGASAAAAGVPNSDIPTPLASPQPRVGLAPIAATAGRLMNARPHALDDHETPPGLPLSQPELGLMRGMGLPVPTAEGSAADARDKQAGDFAARRAKVMAAPGQAGLIPDVNQLREYANLGLEETKAPDFMKPIGHIRILAGANELAPFPMYGEDYYKAQQPGSPQAQEVERQAMGRQALLAALHGMGDLTKLQEAKLHAQMQQANQHSSLAQQVAAAGPGKTAPELIGHINQINALGGLIKANQQAVGLPGGNPPQPGLKTVAQQAAEDQVGQATKQLQADTVAAPDDKEFENWKISTLPGLSTPEALIKDLSGRDIFLKHEPTRQRIVKQLQEQGGTRFANLSPKLEELLLAHALESGQLPSNHPGSVDINGVQLQNEPGFWSNRYFWRYPGKERTMNVSTLPFGHTAMGVSASMTPTWRQQTRAEHGAQARAAASLLGMLQQYRGQ